MLDQETVTCMHGRAMVHSLLFLLIFLDNRNKVSKTENPSTAAGGWHQKQVSKDLKVNIYNFTAAISMFTV